MTDIDPDLLERVSRQMDLGREALRNGDGITALAAFKTLAEAVPPSAELYYWIYSAALCAGDPQAAATLDTAVLLHAVDLMPSIEVDVSRFDQDAAYDAQLFETCYGSHYVGLASVFARRALDLGRRDANLMVRYALSLQHQGRAEEACDAFRNAFAAYPSPAVGQFYLYSLFHVPNGVHRYAAEARAWAERFASAEVTPRWAPEPLNGRRLRVGYVAPSFTKSQVYQFILPVLENHDPDVVDVTLYTADAAAELSLPCGRMVSIGALDDKAAADLIRSHQLDILIDTWGHTSGSRMGIFARRAAPVQVAWINFVQTTGLPQMDYVLHSDSMAAPGTAELFVEKIWSMGDITIPYRPAMPSAPDVPPPALQNGYTTFGCFNHPSKISAVTVAAWARILKDCPNSILLLKYSYFTDPVLQRIVEARFAAHGVDSGRLRFEGHSKGQDYVESFQRIDLALDPSPCPGGTSTCDALANGVPVLTLAGDNFFARIGIQGVAVAGLPDMVAESWNDYVAKAVKLGSDWDALTQVRARVRPGFEASALRDEAGFTRNLESVFLSMTEKAIAESGMPAA